MVTDRPPRRRVLLGEFLKSEKLSQIELPASEQCSALASSIESAMKLGTRTAILQACSDFLAVASNFYEVKTPDVRVLAARPLRIRETGSIELFGDYTFNTMMIRVWTRTAVRKQITSFGTFLSTLCHEFCHHLDCQRLGFRQSPHTRGFYERTALLYHHARGTPAKRLMWVRMPGNRWRIDWQRMRSSI